jgi:GlpG protein
MKSTSDLKLSPLVKLEQYSIALLFANYLTTLSIVSEVIKDDDGSTICCDEDHYEQAKLEFEAFIKQPHHPKYQQAAWQQSEAVDIPTSEYTFLKTFKENFLSHAGIVTLSVFALCWLVFIASEMGMANTLFNQLQFYSSLSIEGLIAEPWRVLGPALFHFSLLHIVFNTMWWWQLGGSIEKTLGKGMLITLLLVSAVASNVAQFIVSGPNFGGLSGVVYALVGFVWWFGYLVPTKGLSLSKPIISFLLFWLLLGFVDLLPVNIANTAHLVGLISGCLLALVFANKYKET